MQHPYQCCISIPAGPSQEYLLAACGSNLVSFCTKRKIVVSEWSAGEATTDASQPAEDDTNTNNGEPPAKRVKHDNNNNNNNNNNTTGRSPRILKLVASPDNKSVVTITDDKAVRVLSLSGEGRLHELSQRCMPKRPCAVRILPDNATILVGDKFGDVYSLPLFPAADELNGQGDGGDPAAPPHRDAEFKPTATNLTVHTKRNRMALEAQMKQTNLTPRKEGAKFEHRLQLGHVSMLTDMTTAVAAATEGGRPRQYILTADRDEHIRVSRAPPQAHVIEGYCLGHTEFISKIRLTGDAKLLFSGGGDDWVGLWDWQAGQLIRKLDLRAPLSTLADIDPAYGTAAYTIAVSGIWTLPLQGSDASAEVLAVALEKVPALFVATVQQTVSAEALVSEFAVIQLDGNPLDVFTGSGSDGDHQTVISLDRREQGQNRLQLLEVRRAAAAGAEPVTDGESGAVTAPTGRILTYDQESQSEPPLAALNNWRPSSSPSSSTSVGATSDKELEDLLYGVGNLRKRGGIDAEGGGVEGEGTTTTAPAAATDAGT